MTKEAGDRARNVAAEEILAAMVHQHGPAVYRLALSIVRDPALAEDVAQETFIRAWQGCGTYRGEAPLRHWLLRIAHNVAVSTLRTVREEARDPQTLPGHHAHGEGSAVESLVENRMAIQQALDHLDELSRAMVILREVEGLTYAEIGSILGLPLPTVKTSLFRARLTLKKMTELEKTAEDGTP